MEEEVSYLTDVINSSAEELKSLDSELLEVNLGLTGCNKMRTECFKQLRLFGKLNGDGVKILYLVNKNKYKNLCPRKKK